MFDVFGFYKFKKINSLKKNKTFLHDLLIKNNIRGTIIISKEGLNGTISGQKKNLDAVIKKIQILFNLKNFDNNNKSKSLFQPFLKPKVKIKIESKPLNSSPASLLLIIEPSCAPMTEPSANMNTR